MKYRVYVNSRFLSQHQKEQQALVAARAAAVQNPTAKVWYSYANTVKVVQQAPTPAPTPTPPPAPVAAFTATLAGLTATLDASTSQNAVAWEWDVGGYSTEQPRYVAGKIVTVTYPHGGERIVVLTVRNAAGASATATKTFMVTAPAPAPEPTPTPTPNPTPTPTPAPDPVATFSAAVTGLTAVLDASASQNAVSWDWDVGQSPNPYLSGKVVTVTYLEAGERNVVLTVKNADGKIASAWKKITLTAPAPAPTPTPTPTPTPGAVPIKEVTFEKYTTTAALMGDGVAFNLAGTEIGVPTGGVGKIELDTTVGPPIAGLTKSMRYDYQHPGTGCNSITIQRQITFPAAQEAWAEFYIRWSPNFKTTNNACQPNDHKLIFGDTEADESGRWAFYVGAGVGPYHELGIERPLGPEGFLGGYALNKNATNIRPYPELWNGAWHVIRLYFRNSTTTSSRDGAMKAWINGINVHDEAGFNTMKPASNGGGPEKINGFSFCHNKDDGPPGVLMSIWWGRIRVFTTNPGW
jgi:PKD repeat protein